MSLLRDGQEIGNTYVVERLLGEGAFAEVYRVQHRFLGRQAMKVFKAVGMTLEEIHETLGEAALLSKIGHPNIIRVFDANVLDVGDGTLGYFTMEYVPGGTLEGRWKSYRDQFMPVGEVVEILRQVCAGLSVAHSEDPPIIHRDIKPQNVLIGYDGGGMRVRVSDFGLAKRVNPLTLLTSAQGTLGFKPPEAFANMDSCAADVWALGTTLYLLLTDTLPYPALDERDIMDSRRFIGALRPPSMYNIRVDPALDAIVARCLALNPEDRYPNAAALLKDLNEWTPGEGGKKAALEASSTRTAKSALGRRVRSNRDAAASMVRRALRLSEAPGKLLEAADRSRYRTVERDLREAIDSRDPDVLRQRIEDCCMLALEVLRRRPEFWVAQFKKLVERKAEMRDQALAEQLIAQGRRAINNNDLPALQAVVRQLDSLLPTPPSPDGVTFDPRRTIRKGH